MVALLFHQQTTTSLPKSFVLFLPVQQCGCSAGSRFFSLPILLAYWICLTLDCLIKTSPLLRKCIRLLSTSSGVAYTNICEFLIPQRLSTSIINDPLHPRHLANALSTSNTRSSFKYLRCRTSLYRNSLIPGLARYLVNPKQEVNLLSSNLS